MPTRPTFIQPLELKLLNDPVEKCLSGLFKEFFYKGGPIGFHSDEIDSLKAAVLAHSLPSARQSPSEAMKAFFLKTASVLAERGDGEELAWAECNRLAATEYVVNTWLSLALAAAGVNDTGRVIGELVEQSVGQLRLGRPRRIDGKRFFPEPDIVLGSTSEVVAIELKSRGTGWTHKYDSGQFLQYVEMMEGLRAPSTERAPLQHCLHIVLAPDTPTQCISRSDEWLEGPDSSGRVIIRPDGLRSSRKKWMSVLGESEWEEFIHTAVSRTPVWLRSYADLERAAKSAPLSAGTSLPMELELIRQLASPDATDVRELLSLWRRLEARGRTSEWTWQGPPLRSGTLQVIRKTLDGSIRMESIVGEPLQNRFFEQLARYVAVLERGAESTNLANERPIYERRLASAARMFAALYRRDLDALRQLLESEDHAVGWGYLDGRNGAEADAAFAVLATEMSRFDDTDGI